MLKLISDPALRLANRVAPPVLGLASPLPFLALVLANRVAFKSIDQSQRRRRDLPTWTLVGVALTVEMGYGK